MFTPLARVVKTHMFTAHQLHHIDTQVDHMIQHSGIATTNTLTDQVQRWSKNLVMHMLPLGLYAHTLDQAMVPTVNARMCEQWHRQYHDIQAVITGHYGTTCVYAEDLQRPGFHVYTNCHAHDTAHYTIERWHQDQFDQLTQLGYGGGVDSWVIVIRVPQSGAGLSTTAGHLAYAPGDVIMWPGVTPHAIAPFRLAPGERRVTWQMHVVRDLHRGPVIFW
jgi:hypothetical protein